jgi:hypothetical protein
MACIRHDDDALPMLLHRSGGYAILVKDISQELCDSTFTFYIFSILSVTEIAAGILALVGWYAACRKSIHFACPGDDIQRV